MQPSLVDLLPLDVDAATFRIYQWMHIRRAEDHESREWLRRDGRLYDDPHVGPSTEVRP